MPSARPVQPLAISLLGFGLTLLLAACSALSTPAPPPTAREPVLAGAAADSDTVQSAAELAALTARVTELETRIARLERARLAAQASAPPANPSAADAPGAEPTTPPTETAGPVLIPTSTPVIVEALTPQTPTGPSDPPGDIGPSGQTVIWSDARAYLNQTVTVCGPVVAAQFAQQSNGQPTFLNVGKAFPAPDRFQVVIWGNQRAAFPTAPEIAYRDRNICVTGLVGEYRGAVEVTILGPDEIWVVNE